MIHLTLGVHNYSSLIVPWIANIMLLLRIIDCFQWIRPLLLVLLVVLDIWVKLIWIRITGTVIRGCQWHIRRASMIICGVARVQNQMLAVMLLRTHYGIWTAIMLLVESCSFSLLLVSQGCSIRLLVCSRCWAIVLFLGAIWLPVGLRLYLLFKRGLII